MKRLQAVLLFVTVLLSGSAFAQIIVPDYTACPNQTMMVAPVWNNVTNITYYLTLPTQAAVQVPAQFTIGGTTPNTTITYTLTGNGTANNGTVTSTIYFNLYVSTPAPLTFTNDFNFCPGTTGSFTTTIGGASYSVSGGCAGNMVSTSNVITLPNLTSGCAGNYTVNSVINGCARTGTTVINVAPNNQLAVTSPTSICLGSCVTLTAGLTLGTGFQWLDPSNSPVGPQGTTYSSCTLPPQQSGIYTMTANIVYTAPGAPIPAICPRTATTSILVVATNPVNATASPANIVCQGTPLTLNAVVTNANGYSWSGPQSFFSTQQNPVISQALPTVNGNYSVTAFFYGGNSTCSTSAVVNVSVVPVSQPVITGSTSICEGPASNVTYSASTFNQNNGIKWTGPCAAAGSVGSQLILNGLTTNCTGVYYATALFQVNTTTCSSTASVALNVIPVNSITVIPPPPVCMPNNVFLQANAPGANSYLWKGPNNFNNPGANVTVFYPNTSYSGQYTVTAYFGNGNLVCTNTNVVNVQINPALTFSLDKFQRVCYDQAVTLTGPAGASSYTWTSSTGKTANTKDFTFNAIQTTDAGTYTLALSYGPCITRDDTQIEVLDHVSFSLTPSDKQICAGDTIVLEGALQGGSQNYAYYWNPPVYMNSPVGNQKVVVPLGSIGYNLIAHDIACPFFTVATSCSITVKNSSIPKLELDRGRGCSPFILRYNTKIPAGEAIVTYDWGNDLVVQKDNFDYALTKPGTYNLKVYTKNVTSGCSNLFVYPFELIVDPSPGADFYTEPERPTTADRVVFHPTNSYDPITRISWQFEGGVDLLDTSTIKSTTSIDTSDYKTPERLYNVAGKYRTMLLMENDWGCVDTVYKLVDIIDDLNIYIPNSFTPNGDGINDVFFVKGMGMSPDNYSLQIVDRWGNIVFESRDINQGWDGKVRGAPARDGTYTCFVKVVGVNGEGRKTVTSALTIIK